MEKILKAFFRSNISDIKPLENWDVSKASNLSDFFGEIESLTNILPIKNLDVSKCQNLSGFLSGCNQLIDISPIQN